MCSAILTSTKYPKTKDNLYDQYVLKNIKNSLSNFYFLFNRFLEKMIDRENMSSKLFLLQSVRLDVFDHDIL